MLKCNYTSGMDVWTYVVCPSMYVIRIGFGKQKKKKSEEKGSNNRLRKINRIRSKVANRPMLVVCGNGAIYGSRDRKEETGLPRVRHGKDLELVHLKDFFSLIHQ